MPLWFASIESYCDHFELFALEGAFYSVPTYSHLLIQQNLPTEDTSNKGHLSIKNTSSHALSQLVRVSTVNVNLTLFELCMTADYTSVVQWCILQYGDHSIFKASYSTICLVCMNVLIPKIINDHGDSPKYQH